MLPEKLHHCSDEPRMDDRALNALTVAAERHTLRFKVAAALIEKDEVAFTMRERGKGGTGDQSGETAGVMLEGEKIVLDRSDDVDGHPHP